MTYLKICSACSITAHTLIQSIKCKKCTVKTAEKIIGAPIHSPGLVYYKNQKTQSQSDSDTEKLPNHLCTLHGCSN